MLWFFIGLVLLSGCSAPSYDFDEFLTHDSSVNVISSEDGEELNERFNLIDDTEWLEYVNRDFDFSFKFPSKASSLSCTNYDSEDCSTFIYEDGDSLFLTTEYQCDWDTGEVYETADYLDNLSELSAYALHFSTVEMDGVEAAVQEVWGENCIFTGINRTTEEGVTYLNIESLDWPDRVCQGGKYSVLHNPDTKTLILDDGDMEHQISGNPVEGFDGGIWFFDLSLVLPE